MLPSLTRSRPSTGESGPLFTIADIGYPPHARGDASTEGLQALGEGGAEDVGVGEEGPRAELAEEVHLPSQPSLAMTTQPG